jgi:hypothetical protein
MTPRSGGEADKFGNRYEAAWTVRQVLDVLAGRADSIQVEPFNPLGQGVEFVLAKAGVIEAHQVKRQRGQLANWTLKALQSEGVLEAAAAQVDQGHEFHFVSLVPARDLSELSDRARRADDLKAFIDGQLDGKHLRSQFDSLTAVWGDPLRAWTILRSTYVAWPDERELRASNAVMADVLLTGAPPLATTAALAEVVSENCGLSLNRQTVLNALVDFGITAASFRGTSTATDAVDTATNRWIAAIAAELLDPPIVRAEVEQVTDALTADTRVLLAVGSAGAGKSGVLYQVATDLRSDGWPVLALRLDRTEPFSTAENLGQQLGLPASPVATLAAAANEQDCLLVIDQLDAVSFASGRMPASFDGVAEMVSQASAFPRMRVLLASRQFDVDNDRRIHGLVSDKPGRARVDVNPLTEEQVEGAIVAMGMDPNPLTGAQRELLRVPLNLVLLRAILDHGQAPAFQTTKDLLESFWNEKRRESRERAGHAVRFEEVIARLVERMSVGMRLAVPSSTLDAGGLQDDADVLRSAHVLVDDGSLTAFFHETFFDYAFARDWTTRGESLVGFLLGGAQELFRRAQVRQVLVHLRSDDPARFRRELEDLMRDARIRFHIKDVALASLHALSDPTTEDWALVQSLIAGGTSFEGRLWQALRSDAWFLRLDDLGLIAEWLNGESEDAQGHALELMVSAATSQPERLTRLLTPHVGRPEFPRWFMWLSTWLPFHADRGLFDLLLRSVERGDWNDAINHLGMVVHDLGQAQPDWASELLAAWLIDRPNALAVADGRVADLENGDYSVLQLTQQAAAGAPRAFVERLLEYMLSVMSLTELPSDRLPRPDVHFSYRTWRSDRYRLSDVLLYAMGDALTKLAADEPEALARYLQLLAADPHDGAQWLLYEALRGDASRNASWAAQILLEGEERLWCGYNCSPLWTTRQLLEACGPHFDPDDFERLEHMLTELAPSWEKSPTSGLSSFTLLTALPEDRLSPEARRRLGELRRRFESDEPLQPRGVIVGSIAPPVPKTAADHMTDEQWIGAIVKHAEDRESWGTFTGGAREQAQVLAQQTEEDPARFARLSLHLGREHNPEYLGAILRGLGQTGKDVDPDLVFEAVRHAAALQQPELDRWIPWALKKALDAEMPEDVIFLVLERALGASDPEKETWLQTAGSGQPFYGGDPFHAGMNSERGGAALVLGDLLVYDVDGHRTELVAGRLEQLAGDSSVAVRSCVAHVLTASLRHAPDAALAAFDTLVAADDRLLATDPVERLIATVAFRDVERARSAVSRMLASDQPDVRDRGGRLAGYLGLEVEASDLLEAARVSQDESIRAGAAWVCAQRLPVARDGDLASRTLRSLFNDPSEKVRDAAARVAGTLRDHNLVAHRDLLIDLIASATFPSARTQLLFTLERSPLGDMSLAFAERFLQQHGSEVGEMSSRVGFDAKNVAELLMRTYAQSPEHRSRVLDLLDELLLAGVWGVEDVIQNAER